MVETTQPTHPPEPRRNLYPLIKHFKYSHLPDYKQEVFRPFAELAEIIADLPPGPETSTALRKLIESRDCVERAGLG